ncbi:MAG: TIGR03016 family PEP-CTERM system-associated outer membrane protein, partial [Paraglaciecola sp.]
VDISECFQPDTINYVLKAGEEYLDFNQLEADVSEQSIFRKNGKVALSYGMNKIRLSAIASYRKVTYLESGRTRLNNTISLNLNYKLSHKTNISLNASQGKDKENNDLFYDTNRNISIKVNRSLNKSLRLSLSARYLNRDSEDLTFGYFVTDKRLTLGLNYSFN